MITLLARIFIKQKPNKDDMQCRTAYGILAGAVGIFLNLGLFIVKLIAGLITGSIAIMADAFNNLSDVSSSVVILLGFRIAAHKPDSEHPFGHGRVEYISGLIVAEIIILMAFELFIESVKKIMNPSAVSFAPVSVIILLVAIGVKIYMAYYNRSLSKKLKATAMKASAVDSISDVISTSMVLLSTILSSVYGLPVDGYGGLLVAVFIAHNGIKTAKEMLDPLLGQSPNEELMEEIAEIVMEQPGIVGMHDVIVHDYGPGRFMITLHVEVDEEMSLTKAHEIVNRLEEELDLKMHANAVIHVDPMALHDMEQKILCEKTIEIVKAMNPQMSIHDFHKIQSTLENGKPSAVLDFDVSCPFHEPLSDEDIICMIQKYLEEATNGSYTYCITVDRV